MEIWINVDLDGLRRLCSSINLRQRLYRALLYGLGEFLQRRPHPIQDHRWRLQRWINLVKFYRKDFIPTSTVEKQREWLSKFIMLKKNVHGTENFRSHPAYAKNESDLMESIVAKFITSSSMFAQIYHRFTKFYTVSDYYVLRARFFLSYKWEKATKFKEWIPTSTMKWDLFTSLASFWKAVVESIDKEYDRLI